MLFGLVKRPSNIYIPKVIENSDLKEDRGWFDLTCKNFQIQKLYCCFLNWLIFPFDKINL
jgi:hypothetical protein